MSSVTYSSAPLYIRGTRQQPVATHWQRSALFGVYRSIALRDRSIALRDGKICVHGSQSLAAGTVAAVSCLLWYSTHLWRCRQSTSSDANKDHAALAPGVALPTHHISSHLHSYVPLMRAIYTICVFPTIFNNSRCADATTRPVSSNT